MPFIVTTTTPCEECHGQGEKRPSRAHMSHEVNDCPACGTSGVADRRHAVATLEDAQWDTDLLTEEHGGSVDEWPDLAESGGTIGPLPDGTGIAVRPVEWADMLTELVQRSLLPPGLPYTHTPRRGQQAQILAAWNAAQEEGSS